MTQNASLGRLADAASGARQVNGAEMLFSTTQVAVRRWLAITVATVAAAGLWSAVAGPSAHAAGGHRRVGFGFFGTVINPGLTSLDQQMALMAQSGVESVRTDFYWRIIEPAPGVFDFSSTDPVVAAAAAHGLDVLPIVFSCPQWASSHPTGDYGNVPPRNPLDYANFMTALVARYGPRGSFWAQNRKLPRIPIRAWQVWDEPAGTQYDWKVPLNQWAPTYVPVLRAAYAAVHRADRGAKLVMGATVGLNTTTLTPWAEMSTLYAAGLKGAYDVAAVNAFSSSPKVSDAVNRVFDAVRLVHDVMRKHGEGNKKVWLTETTWTAAIGRIPTSNYVGIETTPQGQAQRLAGLFSRLAANPGAGVTRVYWYTWFTPYSTAGREGNNIPTFQFSGLVQDLPGPVYKPLPVLGTYANVTARFEGCRKTGNARRCR